MSMVNTPDPMNIIHEKFDGTNQLIDDDHLIWYLLFCYEADDKSTSYREHHHILPKKDFPEYKNINKNIWNGVYLTGEHHLISHYILAKALKNKNTVCAFNMMRRVLPKNSDLSMYSDFREDISKALSDINAGRITSKETKHKLSDNMIGKVVVRDKNMGVGDNHFRTSIDDPDYISGNLVSNPTGRKHSTETKCKMSRNGIGGKQAYTNILTGIVIYLKETDMVPDGFQIGNPKLGELASSRFQGDKFYHDPITNTQRRFVPGTAPEGWVEGKFNFHEKNPFYGKKIFYNYENGETGYIDKDMEYPKYCASVLATNAFIIGNTVTFNISTASRISGYTINTIRIIKDTPTSKITNKSRDTLAKLSLLSEYGDLQVKIMTIDNFFRLKNYRDYSFS